MGACNWKGGNSRITQYENDTNEPTLADIAAMAAALGVTPPQLAYGDSVLNAAKQSRPLVIALGVAAEPLTDDQLVLMIQVSGYLKNGIEVQPVMSARREQKPEDGGSGKTGQPFTEPTT